MKERSQHIIRNSVVEEPQAPYGFSHKSADERLKEDIFRPDMEKLQLFTRMLRKNALLKKGIVTHHQ
jgi:hypothetical protein